MQEIIKNEIEQHILAAESLKDQLMPLIKNVSEILIDTIRTGNKIILFGNGGSAADAQHIAAELSGRYRKERKALPALALTTDTSALTAISNDYGFKYMFSRQVEALAERGDAVIGISTSGNSENVVHAISIASNLGCKTIGLSGKGGGKLKDVCDLILEIPSDNTARIQEMHILIGHIFCEIIENNI
jgi:D-sedoheptulose 7-phosphate isomerase